MLSTDDVYQLINYTAFVESGFTAVSVGGLLWLRYKRPDLPRPIKVNLILPIIFFVICGFLIVLPLFTTPALVGIAMLIIFSGVPVYLLFIYWKNKPSWLRKVLSE